MTDLKEKEAAFESEQAQTEQAKALVVKDDSNLSMYLDTAKFAQTWRAARMLASAGDMVPQQFQGQAASVFVVLELAARADMSPLMMLQNMYMVHGRPGMEAKLMIALANRSGLFSTPLDYDMFDDPEGGRGCVAYATRQSDGKVLRGTPVTMAMAQAEGWSTKSGSKWKTMPELMLRYRAAAFFCRLHCPEVLMGLRSTEEIDDIEAANEVTVTMDPEADVPAFEVPKDDPEPAPKLEPDPPPDDDPGPAEFESPAPETTPIGKPPTYAEMKSWAKQDGMTDVEFVSFAAEHGVNPKTRDGTKLFGLESALSVWAQGSRE
jgi:hypothetical protein